MREIENRYKFNSKKGGSEQDNENENPNPGELGVYGFKNYTNERFNMEEDNQFRHNQSGFSPPKNMAPPVPKQKSP